MGLRLNSLVILLFTFLFVPQAGAATDAATCLACHGSMEGSVNVNQERFARSVHGSFDCVTCHPAPKGDQHKGMGGASPDKAGNEYETCAHAGARARRRRGGDSESADAARQPW